MNASKESTGDIIRKLQQNGFKYERQNGSHRIYKKGMQIVSIPYHGSGYKISGNIIHRVYKALEEAGC